uniref:RNA-directed DNA polymerase n=1 Tax=Cacopsylla melanoneura TaxID=428564 RepID=A0A8D8WSP4_9HEMI
MKSLARSHLWFPGIDLVIENYVKSCVACQSQANSTRESSLAFWPSVDFPFQRIHIDFAEYDKKNLFIVVDAYSKWIHVDILQSTDTSSTIQCLENLFAVFGLPETCVSDNGPQLVSREMCEFMDKLNIKMINSPPYHPKSNGAAERAVQVVKRALEKQEIEKNKYTSFKQRISSLLYAYRNTPHSVTGKSPSELIFKYVPKTKLSKLKNLDPVRERVKIYQDYQMSRVNENRTVTEYSLGEEIWVRSVRGEKVKWFPGNIIEVQSPYIYKIRTDHETRIVHVDHLRKRFKRTSREIKVPNKLNL